MTATRTPDVRTRAEYPRLLRKIKEMPAEKQQAYVRYLALNDLFFLGVYVLRRRDANNDWVFARAREVQAQPNNHLDLWARGHFKSSIITSWLTIQDILANPDITFGIFSHTRPIAKAFLRQIKQEFERNEWLKELFPDVLYEAPQKQSPKWSEDDGIIVQRKSNPKEATVEAWGLVDGQPTSKHFKVLLYDDVVTRESVTTPEMIGKVTAAWELSTNLGSADVIKRFAGTRYHFADTYAAIMKKGAVTPRVYPATVDGTVHGEPVLMSRAALAEKRADQGPFVFGAQMLLNPKSDDVQGFNRNWLRYYEALDEATTNRMVKVLLVDPASAKKRDSDYTSAWVLGLHSDQNIYALDGIRDRLNLSERWRAISALHRRWRPIATGYERYGKDADIEHFEHMMQEEQYRFVIDEVGGSMPKPDRIKRLIPMFEKGKIWLPNLLARLNYEGVKYDVVAEFVEEYDAFPVGVHDDMLDALARVFDVFSDGLPFPAAQARDEYQPPPHMAGRESLMDYGLR